LYSNKEQSVISLGKTSHLGCRSVGDVRFETSNPRAFITLQLELDSLFAVTAAAPQV
jgi:hypothetical protein